MSIQLRKHWRFAFMLCCKRFPRKNNMRYATSCVAQLYLFLPTLQKDLVAYLRRSNFDSLRLLMAHCWKLRPS